MNTKENSWQICTLILLPHKAILCNTCLGTGYDIFINISNKNPYINATKLGNY